MRDALLVGAAQTGKIHPDLLGEPLPKEIEHLWEWFGELKLSRANSGFGVSPVTFTEMLAWSALTGRSPTPFEVQVLRDLDLLYMRSVVMRAEEAKLTV